MNQNISGLFRSVFLALFLLAGHQVFAQTGGGNNVLLISIVAIAAVVLIGIVVQVADSMMQVQAKKHGISTEEEKGFLSTLQHAFRPKMGSFVGDDPVHVLRKGHDIHLEGEAENAIEDMHVTRYAMQPPNFRGIFPIPKLHIAEGDYVKAGDPVFYDKRHADIQFVAPVSGEFIELKRGEKRSVAEIIFLADREIQYKQFDVPDLETTPREALVAFMMQSGLWPHIVQRPFDTLADPNVVPANIFISTFDSAPLAPDMHVVMEGREEMFQKGLDVLVKLTEGSVHLGLNARAREKPSDAFLEAKGVEKHWFYGPHPSGNVGIQIHHIDPIRPDKPVWVLKVQDVVTIGTMFAKGIYDVSRVIALTGAQIHMPKYVRTYAGAHIHELLKDNLKEGHVRIISGDVLSGEKKNEDGYVNLYDHQVTVIREGDHYELFGWLFPVSGRPSISRTFPNFIFPEAKFTGNTNTHGERRAFVVTGQYESVLPMDLYPQHLMKAILTEDFEKMEKLGIHELSEEDIALCEFACTSKIPLQKILREGLDLMQEQG